LYALHHHESFDGSGYPGGLRGEDIPIGSRVISVIDAYDAMTSDRCYRKGLSHEEAVRRLITSEGKQFDPTVVHAFLEIAEQQEIAQVRAATDIVPALSI
jgi:HD-GYP domain-containing protein (c-di-GMP phosphodiesterase class II)